MKKKLLKEMNNILENIENGADLEESHVKLDALLLKYIGDKDVEELFNLIPKYYA